jgi:[CysO sulfur-carrier protein]-S-L-cysteine hydrolase
MITIAARSMEQITKAAEDAYPNECCGLLAGLGAQDRDITITRVQPSDNVAEERIQDRFEVAPKVRFDLMRELENGPERIVGHYHSHPDHPAKPSDHDLKMAFEPDLVWLIVAVTKGKAADCKAYRVNEDATAFQETPLSTDLKGPS